MSAQPVHEHEPDPRDPQVILGRLPEQARPFFLTEYRAAVDAAHDPAGYRALQEMLRLWSIRVVAYSKPDYYSRMDEVREGRGEYTTMEEILERRPI